MTISDEDRHTMIKYRTEQANEVIKEVEILLKNGLLKVAVNRIYYGMFYILNALFEKSEVETLYAEMKDFISTIEKHISSNGKIKADCALPGIPVNSPVTD